MTAAGDPPVDPARLRHLLLLFERIVECPEPERERQLDEACAGDRELRAELARMLAVQSRPGFLRPLSEVVEWDEVAPERIGPFRILRRLGQGGFATVYLAEQEEPVRREVALKVLHARHPAREARLRFVQERQVLARMQHPGIAQLFDAGETADGLVYFAMEVVPGHPLIEWCDRERCGIERRLALVAEVCDAVQHAHQRSVIHRDLKPSNVLVSASGGRAVAKVIDFGVAKLVAEAEAGDGQTTRAGLLVGTPAYMSPEQARGEPIDTRTDVYALGTLLYVLLSGQPPFEPRMPWGEREREGEPRRLSAAFRSGADPEAAAARRGMSPEALARALRGDAQWVVRKALAPDPDQRYASASELAADLRALAARRPVSVREHETWYLVRRFAARHRLALLVAAAFAGVVVASTVVLALALRAVDRARDAAEDRRIEADERRQEAVENEYVAQIFASGAALDLGDLVSARAKLRATPPDHRGWEWRYLAARCESSTRVIPLPGVGYEVFWLDAGRVVVGGTFGVRVHDAETGALLLAAGEGEFAVNRAAVDPARRWFALIASRGGGTRLELRSLPDLALVRVLDTDPTQRSLAFTPDGQRLAACANDGTVTLHDVEGGGEPRVTCRLEAHASAMRFSRSGRELVLATPRGLFVCDAETGNEIVVLRSGVEPFAALAVPERPGLVYAAFGQDLILWDWRDDVVLARGSVDTLPRQLELSADGRELFVCGDYALAELRAVDAQTLQPRRSFLGHTRGVHGIAVRPDGGALASASLDGTARIWADGPDRSTIRLDAGFDARCLSVAADGESFATADMRGLVRVWNARTLALELEVHLQDALAGCVLGADTVYVAGARLYALDRTTGEVRSSLDLPPGLSRLAADASGRYLVGGWGAEGRLVVWSAPALESLHEVTFAFRGAVRAADRPGALLLCGRTSGVHLLDAATGSVQVRNPTEREVQDAVLCGERLLATTPRDFQKLSELLTADRAAVALHVVESESYAYCVDVAADGSRAVTGAEVVTVRLPGGRELLRLGQVARPLAEVRFCAGDERIVGRAYEPSSPTHLFVYDAPRDADLSEDE